MLIVRPPVWEIVVHLAARRNLLDRKRGSIAYSFSISSAYWPDMIEILLKRT